MGKKKSQTEKKRYTGLKNKTKKLKKQGSN